MTKKPKLMPKKCNEDRTDNRKPGACAVKERPIIFSGEMVRAILEGRKTQTRRVVDPQPFVEVDESFEGGGRFQLEDGHKNCWSALSQIQNVMIPLCPYGQPGDRLWCRESFSIYSNGRGKRSGVGYKADWVRDDSGDRDGWWKGTLFVPSKDISFDWKSPIFMPRWASRCTLEVTGVRVERTQDITEHDARAEGIEGDSHPGTLIGTCRGNFGRLWVSLNASRGFGWDENPWVWVLEFRRLT